MTQNKGTFEAKIDSLSLLFLQCTETLFYIHFTHENLNKKTQKNNILAKLQIFALVSTALMAKSDQKQKCTRFIWLFKVLEIYNFASILYRHIM